MKKQVQVIIGSAIALIAVAAFASPASAAQASCAKTDEVCRVAVSTSADRSIVFSTRFTGNSGTQVYQVYNAAGKVYCKGRIGFNNSGSCTFPGAYTGKVYFEFAKGSGTNGGLVAASVPN